MKRKAGEAGFTLAELMITVSCMMILAAVAVPRMQAYLLASRLEGAKSYLQQIAAKERMYKITTGMYCCSGNMLDENVMSASLGLNLADSGDFCYVFICQSTALCTQTSGPGFITAVSGGPPQQPDFEVWAILLSTAGNATGPGNTQCNAVANKVAPTGFAYPSNSGRAGRAGEVVALRYPPPGNGVGQLGTYHNVSFTWLDGVSTTDALYP